MAKRTCTIEGCEQTHHCKGFCGKHYMRWRRHGDPHARPRADYPLQCSINGCDRPPHARGLCRAHYMRQWHIDAGSPRRAPFEDRFWSRVDVGHPLGCWIWTAGTAFGGYGCVRYEGRNCGAHRVSYRLLVGAIPDGLSLDHLCRNPPCVNPDHLEPVTQGENVLRGLSPTAVNARKTHCVNGHLFDTENTGPSKNGRRCRTCHRNAERCRARTRRRTTGS